MNIITFHRMFQSVAGFNGFLPLTPQSDDGVRFTAVDLVSIRKYPTLFHIDEEFGLLWDKTAWDSSVERRQKQQREQDKARLESAALRETQASVAHANIPIDLLRQLQATPEGRELIAKLASLKV